jgi:hypothetical protein
MRTACSSRLILRDLFALIHFPPYSLSIHESCNFPNRFLINKSDKQFVPNTRRFLLYFEPLEPQIEHRSREEALLFRIREAPSSSLGPEVGYPDRGCLWFSSVPPGKCRDRALNYSTTASSHIISNSLFTDNSTIERCIVWATDSIVE